MASVLELDAVDHDRLVVERHRMRQAELIILALRRRLRGFDPSLPIEYDGVAWSSIEAIDVEDV